MPHPPATDWRAIVFRGVESEELDYKAPQNWAELSRAGKAKFARHCLALANTKGGYLVVGVGEDRYGRPADFAGLTEAQAHSFDPTDVGDFVNRCADPAIDFDLEKPVVDGKQFVIFVVRRFATLPHVCCYSCDREPIQGAFYIRTKDAASRVAYRASEVHALMQRALRNQRELLGRMIRGVLYENRLTGEPDTEGRFRDEARHAQTFAVRRLDALHVAGVRLDLLCFPTQFREERFGLSELRAAVQDSLYTFRERAFAAIGTDAETYSTNVALRSCLTDPPLVWQAFQSGLFHHVSVLPLRAGLLDYDQLCWPLAEATFFLAQFYGTLGLPDELLTLEVQLTQVEGVGLRSPRARPRTRGRGKAVARASRYICRIPEIRVQKRRTAADLGSGVVAHAAGLVREVGERFNLPAGSHPRLAERLQRFLERRR